MNIEENTTGVPEQDTLTNSGELAIQHGGSSVPRTDDSIVEIASGPYEDPRQEVTGKHNVDHGEQINKWGKQQRSITIVLPDGSNVLVSAFGTKAKKLDGLKLGYTYTFKGILKTKTEPYQGKEKTSTFLNL
jgi:hypothetical protein